MRLVSSIVLALVVLAAAPARAERPSEWLFRASPGYGYAWDRAARCPVEGRMLVGGWMIGKFVTPSLLVGGSLGVGVNALPEGDCPLDESGSRMTMGMLIGPAVDWYPFASALRVSATAGYASYDQDSMLTSHGVGATVSVGYDWQWFKLGHGDDARFGIALQATAVRMTGGHATLMPAIVMTLGVD